MTPDESQFSDKAPLEHPITIYTADGTPMPVSHKGTISSPSLCNSKVANMQHYCSWDVKLFGFACPDVEGI